MGTNDVLSVQPCDAAIFGSERLLTLPSGRSIDLASGYIPLLTRFTFEDKAAKGLRKRKAGQKPEPPIHFTALELVLDNKILLLTGPSGSGKTSFAKHLCFELITEGFEPSRSVVRNELSDTRQESWTTGQILPHYFAVSNAESLKSLAKATIPSLLKSIRTGGGLELDGSLIVLDGVEKANHEAPGLLVTISAQVQRSENTRLLILGETSICEHWVLPSDIARHELLPLLVTQRRVSVSKLLKIDNSSTNVGTGDAAGNPALFSLALQAQHPGDKAEDLLDAWLYVVSSQETSAEDLASRSYHQLSGGLHSDSLDKASSTESSSDPSSTCNVVNYLLAARHLSGLQQEAIIQFFRHDTEISQPVVRSCLSRLIPLGRSEPLVEGLLTGPPTDAQRGALIVSDFPEACEGFTNRIKNLMLEIVTQGNMTASERVKAGQVLSRLGDTRDLTALAFVPAGNFTMGSTSHANSQPLKTIATSSFRIGFHPVVNKDYLEFTQDTQREWLSPDSADPERQNAPATDITWHDARAYCTWLTNRWHSDGIITLEEQVRLPSEPEWERAARGDQKSTGGDRPAYPWDTTWQDGAANSEETGLNRTCAVGLFPKGRSPYGCYDMAGHVWEWCTTLWGEDMTTPSFPYPWKDDDREDLDAPEQVRRVLRGGCFSSPKIKANCTYRGSLEPSGFWRGNGFRIVVCKVGS